VFGKHTLGQRSGINYNVVVVKGTCDKYNVVSAVFKGNV